MHRINSVCGRFNNNNNTTIKHTNTIFTSMVSPCWFCQHVTSDIWWYYMLELGFYISLVLSLFMDVRRKVIHLNNVVFSTWHRLRVDICCNFNKQQVAQLWQTDRATGMCCAYIRKVYYAVVGTASGSVQGRPGTRDAVAIRQARKTRTDWPGLHNKLNGYAPCTEHVYVAKSAFFEGGHFRRIFDTEGGIAHQPVFVSGN